MRRLVAVLVVAALAFAVVGCGGGGDEATTVPPAAPAAPAAPAVTDPGYLTDRSATEADAPPVKFPSFITTATPAVFTDKISAARPMLIFFYDPAQGSTNDVRAEIDEVMKEYRGLIDFVTFNVGEKTNGAPTLAAQAAVVYASELGVNSTPYLIAVDRGGYITWRWKGYIERGYIEREVQRATQ